MFTFKESYNRQDAKVYSNPIFAAGQEEEIFQKQEASS